MSLPSHQEALWTGKFGQAYSGRNRSETLLAANVALFERILDATTDVRSVLELGCNIGLNLQALNTIDPSLDLCAYEINEEAANAARKLGIAEVICDSITRNLNVGRSFDLVFTKGVLIHIDPDQLAWAYDNLYRLSDRYVLIAEYYNPTPVTVPYRGQSNALFKRDFAGEMIDRYHMDLVHYGFVYHRDQCPQDDVTWFLLEK